MNSGENQELQEPSSLLCFWEPLGYNVLVGEQWHDTKSPSLQNGGALPFSKVFHS